MAETTVKILSVRDFPSTDPQRLGKFDRWVSFSPDNLQTLYLVMPSETFSEAQLKTEIDKKLKELGSWTGREIKIG